MATETKKIVWEFEATADQPATAFRNMREELVAISKELRVLTEAGDSTSDRFQRLAARAGEIRDVMGDVGAQVRALATDTPKLDLFAGALQGVAAGFGVAQGAAALFGAENEDLQKMMVKLQATQLLVNGATEIANMLQKNSAVLTLARLQVQNLLNSSLIAGAAAATGLSRALVASGLGAIIVALGIAAVALYNFATSASEAELEVAALDRASKELNDTLDDYNRASELAVLAAKARGASETELYNLEVEIAKGRLALMAKQIDAEIKKQTILDKIRKEETDDYADLTVSAAKYGGAIGGLITLYRDWTTDVGEASQKSAEQKKAVNELTFEFEKQSIALDQLTLDYQKMNEEKAKAASEKAADEAKKAAEEERKRQEEIAQILKDARTANMLSTMGDRERELKEIELKYEERFEKVKGNLEAETELEKQMLNERRAAMNKFAMEDAEADKEWADARMAFLREQWTLEATEEEQFLAQKKEQWTQMLTELGVTGVELEATVANMMNTLNKQIADKANKEATERAKNRKKELADTRRDTLQAVGQMFVEFGNMYAAFGKSDLEARKRAFEVQKKAGIAGATVDTYVAASKAFASAKDPILGSILAAIAVAQGLVRIRQISQQQFDGGGAPSEGGGGGGSAPSTVSMPSASDVSSTGADAGGGSQSNPNVIRAYVVDRDIDDAQSRNKLIQNTARL